MKPARDFGPRWLLPVTLALVAWLARAGWQLQNENQKLRAVVAPEQTLPPRPAAASDLAQKREVGGLNPGELRAETRREIAAREAAEFQIAALEKRLPTRSGEVLVSFGSIEQMGQSAAKLVQSFTAPTDVAKHAGRKVSAPQTTAEQTGKPNADMEAIFADFFGHLGELRTMENDPPEIARFQTATLREALGLDAATTERTTAFLETEFARLKAQELTATFRPEKEPADWDRRRDAAMTELAARLRPLLPANHDLLPLLPGILGLGGGLRAEVKMNPDGHGSVKMVLPLFPKIPGL